MSIAVSRADGLLVALAASLAVASSTGCGGGGGGGGGSSTRASATIGPEGGTVALAGGPRLQVPPGALAANTAITLELTGETAPSGAPVYRFGPDGTTFAQPVTVTLPLPPEITAPAAYWSKPGSTTAFNVLPATIAAEGLQVQGSHFSSVFIGPSTGAEVCAVAGTESDGEPCGGGRVCVSGACGARISGAVSGTVTEGLTVTLNGAAVASTTTDSSGHYEFSGLPDGSYTITPSVDGHAFSPPSADVMVSGADVSGQDFTAWQPVLATVSPSEGHVGSTVTLAGDLFGAPGSGGSVTFGGLSMPIVSWSNQQIVAQVPSGATAGAVQVHVGGGASAEKPFVVTATVQGELVDGSGTSHLAGSWAFGGDGSPAQLIVSALGTSRSAVAVSVPGSGYGGMPRAFSLELPLGTYTLAVQELDGSGQPTVDLLQSASRQLPGVVVTEDGLSGLQFPILWHWEVHELDPGYPVCNFEKQIHFRDADHGYVTFQVNPGVDPDFDADRIHGMVMATSDGGRTWTVASPDISSASQDFRPSANGWFPTGFLTALEDGIVLSMGDNGQLVRSVDSGQTWAPASLNWAACGPGGPTPTRFARAGDDALYVSVSTGGVQGSYTRSQLLHSTDEGLTWNRIFDVCNPNYTAPDGCPTQGVPLGFAGIDMACSDLDPQRCITMGYEHDGYTSLVMVTRDGFETFQTIGSKCGYFTDGQVLWFPGTETAWVIASSSCPGIGYQHIVTNDGGETWSDWAPSPLPGRAAFADALNGMSWWDWGVRATRDGGATWLYTGHAPAAGAGLRSVHVLDAAHAWVLGHPDCRTSGAAYVSRWVP